MLGLCDEQAVHGFAGKDPARFIKAAGHPDLFYLEDLEVPIQQVGYLLYPPFPPPKLTHVEDLHSASPAHTPPPPPHPPHPTPLLMTFHLLHTLHRSTDLMECFKKFRRCKCFPK